MRFSETMRSSQWDGAQGWFTGWRPMRLARLAVAFLAQADVRVFAVDDATGRVIGVASGFLSPEGRMRLALLEAHPDKNRAEVEEGLRAHLERHPLAREVVDLGNPQARILYPPKSPSRGNSATK